MRIYILASLPSSLSNFRGALIESLLDLGHEVYAGAPGILEDSVTCDWLNERGVRYHDVPLSRTGLSVTGDLRTFIALRRMMLIIRPDLVLAYTVKPVIWGMIAAWLARVPKRVALITGLGYAFVGKAYGKRAIIRWIVSRLYSIALRRASLVFFQNPDDRAEMRRQGISPVHVPTKVVNGSGVDLLQFPHVDLTDEPPQFLLIARLLGDKGIREYAQAAAALVPHWPGVGFHIVGGLDPNPNGLGISEVEEWVRAGNIIWHGALDDVQPALAAAHVYVLPSYREGTPRTVLEAMATGRAIITTDAPGCRETVQEGENGFLVPVRNSSALTAAMEKFLLEPELIDRMGEQSRRIATEKYDVHKVNAAMIDAMGLQ
jgi:glycosyltransferase involved in cell wall biosynthesis